MFTRDFYTYFQKLIPQILQKSNLINLFKVVFHSIDIFTTELNELLTNTIIKARLKPTKESLEQYIIDTNYRHIEIIDTSDIFFMMFSKKQSNVVQLLPHFTAKNTTDTKVSYLKSINEQRSVAIKSIPIVAKAEIDIIDRIRLAGTSFFYIGRDLGFEFVLNGDFENGLTGWISYRSDLSIDTENPISGTQSIIVTQTGFGGNAKCSISPPMIIGKAYIVQAKLKQLNSVYSTRITKLLFYDSNNVGESAWQKAAMLQGEEATIDIFYIPTISCNVIKLYNTGHNTILKWDSVSVRELL